MKVPFAGSSQVNMDEEHRNKLSLLCFVCGKVFKKSFDVSTHLKNLKQVFYIDETVSYTDENIFPQRFCSKCYLKALNIIKRKTTTTPIDISVWKKHSPDKYCNVCDASTQSKGGRKKKLKIKTVGRPSMSNENVLWTRRRSEALKASTPHILPGFLDVVDQLAIPEELNPQIDHCKCKLCDKILNQAIKLKVCEEQFCLDCLLPKLEGRSSEELTCPHCATPICFEDVASSHFLISLIKSIKVKCNKGCSLVDNVCNYKAMLTHQNDCKGSQKTWNVNDILALNSSSKIPIEAEKAAANIIKLKMKNEVSGTRVSLPTSSSHVSIFFNSLFLFTNNKQVNYKFFQNLNTLFMIQIAPGPDCNINPLSTNERSFETNHSTKKQIDQRPDRIFFWWCCYQANS